jgi:hypothetical protein
MGGFRKHHNSTPKTPVQPQRSFVIVSPNDWENLRAGKPAQEAFWSFTLEPWADGHSRLIARVRGTMPPTLASRAADRLFWEPMHFVMEQKMLRTIRDLSERG